MSLESRQASFGLRTEDVPARQMLSSGHLIQSLPKPKQKGRWDLGGWEPSIVEMFDRKSGSSLKEVSMQTQLKSDEAKSMVRVLAKSKETLQFVRLQDDDFSNRSVLYSLSLMLPNLVDCRITDTRQNLVHFIQRNSNQDSEDQGCKLRILWCRAEKLPLPFPRRILTGLVSLSLECFHPASEWMQILETSAETLKHLALTSFRMDTLDPPSPLELPNLEVLEIRPFGMDRMFPSWIKFGPSFSSLICHEYIYSSLPSVSTLWVQAVGHVNRVANSCPELVELRIMEACYVKGQDASLLIPMLKERKRDVEDGVEIEGVKMIQLKRLMIDFSEWKTPEINEMRELVDEVLDLSLTPTIELEI